MHALSWGGKGGVRPAKCKVSGTDPFLQRRTLFATIHLSSNGEIDWQQQLFPTNFFLFPALSPPNESARDDHSFGTRFTILETQNYAM